MKVYLLVLAVLLVHLDKRPSAICVASTPRFKHLVLSISAPISSPSFSHISPIPSVSSAAAVSASRTQTESEEHKTDSRKKLVIAVVVGVSVFAFLLFLLCLWIFNRSRLKKYPKGTAKTSDGEKGLALAPFLGKLDSLKTFGKRGSVSFIDYKLIEKATENFLETNVLGEGGFGRVYKAHLEDNFSVAVKKLECPSHDAEREFQNEVDLLSKIQHPNVISLLGYSSHEDSRFIVYELMENGSLETKIHGPSHGSELTWQMRMKIALDAARGLEYLHEHSNPPVIHRDLKSSNILLDANFNAKLSDFGLAVTGGVQSKSNIKLSGTLGYVAPEYILDGKLTDKSDVYAFGVVLLELLLGRRPVEKLAPAQCQSIVTWAMPQLTDRSKLPNILDPVIKNTMDLKHLYQVAAVAILCVQPEPSYRPLITDILHSLIPLVPIELGGTLKNPPSPC